MKKAIIGIFLLFTHVLSAQSIRGNLSMLANQEIILEGFNGFSTYSIAKTIIDEKGNFQLAYKNSDYGMGYVMSSDNKAFFVILNGEDIEITGSAFSLTESIKVQKGKENLLYAQYAKEQPKREQALSAWVYLEKMYAFDPLFSRQKTSIEGIQNEKLRINKEDALFLDKLPKESYVRWFLPMRKLVSSVSTVAQYRTEEIPTTIAAFRKIDYTDQRLYKSGLLKDAIESHFWLLENSGKSLDSVFIEMNLSIDDMFIQLIKNEERLNEVTDYLFDLLERQSLFQASEYLALKVLNEVSCTIDSDLAKQLETYRAMKIGNTAPDFSFNNMCYLNGQGQTYFTQLSDIQTPYTLVLFGASWCPKCKEELPKVIENYVKWRNLGVEVLYVSLDTDQIIFNEQVKILPFLTYCDFMKWESPIVENYYVFSTPTMFLLNQNREIVLRPNSIAQVDAWVDWNLMQGNK